MKRSKSNSHLSPQHSKLTAPLLTLLLVGSFSAHAQWNKGDPISSTEDGYQTAAALTARYEAIPHDCGGPSKPAFLCSGIIFRFTLVDPKQVYKVWNHSPDAKKINGMSFSFIRQDVNFQYAAWGRTDGFIIYDVWSEPAGKPSPEIKCTYILDAWGWHRKEACGSSQKFPEVPGLCHLVGIHTAQQWVEVWNKQPVEPVEDRYLKQCAFDVSDSRNNLSAEAFYQAMLAMNALGQLFFDQHNELITALWPEDKPSTYPVQAFFYIRDGLKNAQYNQKDFFISTRSEVIVPIIAITLPTKIGEKARFEFKPEDQVITALAQRCAAFIESGTWEARYDPGTKQNEWTLKVTPTPCARKIKEDLTDAAYQELFSKFGKDIQWRGKDGGGMRRQLACLLETARQKEVWNLEPFRPDGSQKAAVAAGCNLF